MPIIQITDNNTGETKEWEVKDESSEVQQERKPRKAPTKDAKAEQAES